MEQKGRIHRFKLTDKYGISDTIGKLVGLRRGMGYSQQAVADRTAISYGTIQAMERCALSDGNVNFNKMVKYARSLGLELTLEIKYVGGEDSFQINQ